MTDAAYSDRAQTRPASPKRRFLDRFRLKIAPFRDPRYGQIIAQAALISLGVAALGFRLSFEAALAAAAGALLAEWIGRVARDEPFDPLSPLITAGSLTLLFRAQDLWLFALAGFLAIASKFLIRMGGRHIFNPAAIVLFALPIAAGHDLISAAWVAPGQWGPLGLFAVGLAGIGALVVTRAARLDTTLAFLLTWAACAFGRALYFGDPMAIPLHQLQSGAVLVFAFFMISDPATTPPTRLHRILHAAVVAMLGFWLQANWFTETGPIWALVFAAPLVGGMRLLTRLRHSQRTPGIETGKET